MAVRVEKFGNRIMVRLPWLGDTRVATQQEAKLQMIIPGARWSKTQRAWSCPLNMTVCRDLRKLYSQQLDIGGALWKWARQEQRREQAMHPLLSAKDVALERVPLVAPKMAKALEDRKYQRVVVKFGVLAKQLLNASQPGLGKTLETLATLVEADVHGLHLVAAPKTSLRTVWHDEIERWMWDLGAQPFVVSGGRQRRTNILEDAFRCYSDGSAPDVFVIINAEMVRTVLWEECRDCNHKLYNNKPKASQSRTDDEHTDDHRVMHYYEHDWPQLFDIEWTSITFDETARYLLHTNLRARAVSQTGVGAMLLKQPPDAYRFGLSGTPMKGKPKNLWSTLHWLRPDQFTSFWNWANRVLEVAEDHFGNKEVYGIADEDAWEQSLRTIMIRHTKGEVLPELPPKFYAGAPLDPHDETSPIAVWVDPPDGKQGSQYSDMEKSAAVALDGGNLTAQGVLAEMMRLKQFACSSGKIVMVKRKQRSPTGEVTEVWLPTFNPQLPSNKWDWILEWLSEAGIVDAEGDSKVVIASQFTKLINLYSAELKQLKVPHFTLTGETSDRNRAAYRDRFQQPGGPRVFLLNTTAGGVSITLDAADDLIINDETWVPDDQEQVEDRIHRTSRMHQVTIWRLLTRGTIDEYIARMTDEKDNLQKYLLDGKRGVEFAKRLVRAA